MKALLKGKVEVPANGTANLDLPVENPFAGDQIVIGKDGISDLWIDDIFVAGKSQRKKPLMSMPACAFSQESTDKIALDIAIRGATIRLVMRNTASEPRVCDCMILGTMP